MPGKGKREERKSEGRKGGGQLRIYENQCRIVSKEGKREKMGEDEKVCPLVDERAYPETKTKDRCLCSGLFAS